MRSFKCVQHKKKNVFMEKIVNFVVEYRFLKVVDLFDLEIKIYCKTSQNSI